MVVEFYKYLYIPLAPRLKEVSAKGALKYNLRSVE